MITFLVVSGAFFIAHGHNALRIRDCIEAVLEIRIRILLGIPDPDPEAPDPSLFS
jgi:hypothetical protein